MAFEQDVNNFYTTKYIKETARELELSEIGRWTFSPRSIKLLEDLLEEVYNGLQPRKKDYDARKTIITWVNQMSGRRIKGGTIKPYGSYTMDLFSTESDLDLSLGLQDYHGIVPKEMKIKFLKQLAGSLRGFEGRRQVRDVEPIYHAVVPIVKFVDGKSGLECDISVENRDGILKSELLQLFSLVDIRFRKLCYLVKYWAKAQDINSARFRTLNSISIILLVAFHLQTRDPPILPPFGLLLEEGWDTAKVKNRVLKFADVYGNGNKESVSELFLSLLCKLLSVKQLWRKGLCASTYCGSWVLKAFERRACWIGVEDFTDHSQNTARSVGVLEGEKIFDCIKETLSRLQKLLPDPSRASELKSLLFEPNLNTNVVGPKLIKMKKGKNKISPDGTTKANKEENTNIRKRTKFLNNDGTEKANKQENTNLGKRKKPLDDGANSSKKNQKNPNKRVRVEEGGSIKTQCTFDEPESADLRSRPLQGSRGLPSNTSTQMRKSSPMPQRSSPFVPSHGSTVRSHPSERGVRHSAMNTSRQVPNSYRNPRHFTPFMHMNDIPPIRPNWIARPEDEYGVHHNQMSNSFPFQHPHMHGQHYDPRQGGPVGHYQSVPYQRPLPAQFLRHHSDHNFNNRYRPRYNQW